MGKVELLNLLEFPFEYHKWANRGSFIKLFPILVVEAGTGSILDVETGMDRLVEGHRADQKSCTWREALPTGEGRGGCLRVLAASPAHRAEHTQQRTQSCAESEIFGRHLALWRSGEPQGR